MEYYYIIIAVLVFLKIMFWVLYFYVRSQRIRAARAARTFVVVETRQVQPVYNDRMPIVQHEELPDTRPHAPPQVVAPPAYEQAIQSAPNKPPNYEQAISSPRVQ